MREVFLFALFVTGSVWAEPVVHESSDLPAPGQLPAGLRDHLPPGVDMKLYERAFRETASFYQVSDGSEILTDEKEGTIWYREQSQAEWQIIRREVSQLKPMGGEIDRLKVRYMGHGKIILTETVKGSERTYETINDETPSALCETLLIDGCDGLVLSRTRPVRYFSIPKVKINPEWLQTYALVTHVETSDYEVPPGSGELSLSARITERRP